MNQSNTLHRLFTPRLCHTRQTHRFRHWSSAAVEASEYPKKKSRNGKKEQLYFNLFLCLTSLSLLANHQTRHQTTSNMGSQPGVIADGNFNLLGEFACAWAKVLSFISPQGVLGCIPTNTLGIPKFSVRITLTKHTGQTTMHQLTTMLSTSKNVLLPGPNHLLTISLWPFTLSPSLVLGR